MAIKVVKVAKQDMFNLRAKDLVVGQGYESYSMPGIVFIGTHIGISANDRLNITAISACGMYHITKADIDSFRPIKVTITWSD